MKLRRREFFALGAAGIAVDVNTTPALAQRQAVDLAKYRQTFAAEFNDPKAPLFRPNGGPFTTKFEEWGGLRTLPATGELELYVDSAFVPAPGGTDKLGRDDAPPGAGAPLGYNPFTVSNGCLNISAIPVPAALKRRVDRPYLSGLVSTEWSFTQRFGYFEIRAQLPPGRGLWPAFWMVSKTAAEHVEIDVFEAVGEENKIYHSIHLAPTRGVGTHVRNQLSFDYADGMHTYGVLWTPTEVVYFVDGAETLRADGAPIRDAPPMYLIACLALGGTWGGAPPAETHFPATLRIDYIRAYQML